MLVIIALVGAKGAGKSTVAQLIRESRPDVKEMALADRLKDVCSGYFGILRQAFDDPSMKERYVASFMHQYEATRGPLVLTKHDVACMLDTYSLPINPSHVRECADVTLYTARHVAQYVGTEVLRAVDPDVHCKALMINAPVDGTLIVTDVRFPNELAYFQTISNVKFTAVYVKNEKAEAVASKDRHESERHLRGLSDACGYVIDNCGSKEDLKGLVELLMSKVNLSKDVSDGA